MEMSKAHEDSTTLNYQWEMKVSRRRS